MWIAVHLLPFVTAVLGRLHCLQQVATDPEDFSRTTFDYVVIGAGTAGIALATRLAERTTMSVGVIEAGELHFNDSLLDIPGNLGQVADNPNYDWGLSTEPQTGANGRSVHMARGKLVGGSSALNFMAWNRASKAEYDSWNAFAPNKGWSWENLLPYFIRSESIASGQINVLPSLPPEEATAGNNAEEVGSDGPIKVSYNDLYLDPVPVYVEALNSLDIRTNADPNNGTIRGVFNSRSNIDRQTGTRSYAASGYFCSTPPHGNLRVLVNAKATKIMMENSGSQGNARATGVQFQVGAELYVVNASKEIILSAGVYQSPQLLELSGIGQKHLLSSLGIENVIDLPGVGENLQDHLAVSMQYEVKPGVSTFDALANNATFAQEQLHLYDSKHTGLFAASNSVLTFLSLQDLALGTQGTASLVSAFDRSVALLKPSAIQRMQYDLQRQWLQDDEVPAIELILFSNSLGAPAANHSSIAILGAGMHLLGRGSVHINTTDFGSPPVIDPKWLNNEFDLQLLLAGFRLLSKVGDTAPLANIIKSASFPIGAMNESAVISHLRETVGSSQHPMGTLAMGPRDKGVVDGNLKIYGTSNLRVCDASVFPIAVGAHLQATVYALAEKMAADIICSSGRTPCHC
ncbi:alcohol oxidase [Mucidula mucida]|nr:alcohol oxidase [Mucidula mucida]